MLTSPTWISRGLEYAVKEILRALSQLDFENNFSQKTLSIVTDPTPGTTFTVTHGLGRIPNRWLANPEDQVTVWEVNRALWTDQEMQLRCSGSSTPVTLTVW